MILLFLVNMAISTGFLRKKTDYVSKDFGNLG